MALCCRHAGLNIEPLTPGSIPGSGSVREGNPPAGDSVQRGTPGVDGGDGQQPGVEQPQRWWRRPEDAKGPSGYDGTPSGSPIAEVCCI